MKSRADDGVTADDIIMYGITEEELKLWVADDDDSASDVASTAGSVSTVDVR